MNKRFIHSLLSLVLISPVSAMAAVNINSIYAQASNATDSDDISKGKPAGAQMESLGIGSGSGKAISSTNIDCTKDKYGNKVTDPKAVSIKDCVRGDPTGKERSKSNKEDLPKDSHHSH